MSREARKKRKHAAAERAKSELRTAYWKCSIELDRRAHDAGRALDDRAAANLRKVVRQLDSRSSSRQTRQRATAAYQDIDLTLPPQEAVLAKHWLDAVGRQHGPWPADGEQVRAAFESAILAGDQITAYEIVVDWLRDLRRRR